MAAITTTEYYNALNETPIDTSVAADIPLFEKDHFVWKQSELALDGTQAPKYKVIRFVQEPQTSGGVTKLMDQTLTFATPADGITMQTVPGFQHTGTISGVFGATTISRPHFYDIQNAATGVVKRSIHQSQLTDEAGAEAYVTAIIATLIP